MRLAVIVCFKDEQALLPRLLDSLARQDRQPDELILCDDGSVDRSALIAAEWCATRSYARVVSRPAQVASADRLARAAELVGFLDAVARLEYEWDLVAKLDADLELPADCLAALAQAFVEDPALGVCGTHLAELAPDGTRVRMPSRDEHVHGATKVYRRACFEQIAPLPAILGWDTLDLFRARVRGWSTRSLSLPGGDPLHLRPMGTFDGLMRGYRRWGEAAWGYGEHPLHVTLLAARRAVTENPRGGIEYLRGYLGAARGHAPRAEREIRAYVGREQLGRIGARLRGGH